MCDLFDVEEDISVTMLRAFYKLVARQEVVIQDQQFMVGFLGTIVVIMILLTLFTHIYYWRK